MDIEFNKNEDAMKLAWSRVKRELEVIHLGGGKKANEKAKRKE